MKIRLLIGGVDLTSRLIEESWQMDDNAGGDIDIAEFELDDPNRDLTVTQSQEAIIESFSDALVRYFGGYVAEIRIEPEGIGRRWFITCQDWKIVLDSSYFSKEYSNQTDAAIIADAFTEAGITDFDTSTLVQTIRTLPKFVFRAASLRQMMDIIAETTNAEWDVDNFKKVVYNPRGSVLMSFGFSDAPDDAATFPFRNISRVQERGRFNYVVVEGALRLQQATDIYSGDGTRTTFNLRIDGQVAGRVYRNIFRGIAGASPDVPGIDRNTGTQGTPIWTAQTVGIELQDTGKDVLFNPRDGKVIWAVAPPNFSDNSWRITGRYASPVVWEMGDQAAIDAVSGRVFKKIIYEPTVETEEQAQDVATAFLREQGPRDTIIFTADRDGLIVGRSVPITSTSFGLTAELFRIRQLSYRFIGGEVAQYLVTAGKGIGSGIETLAATLFAIRRKTGHIDRSEAPAITIMRLIEQAMVWAPSNIEVSTVARGPDYYLEPSPGPRINHITNPGFEVDLTGWIETVSGFGGGYTTVRDVTKSKSGLASLKVTGSGGALDDYVGRDRKDIIAAPGEVLSAAAEVLITALSNARAEFRIEFLDAGDVSLASYTAVSTTVDAINFQRLTIQNKTAPASTAKVRVSVLLIATGATASGTLYWDEIIVEKASAIGVYFDGHENEGFWQGTENLSSSVKDTSINNIIADYWKVAA